jgi:hypothetical protein
MRHVKEAYWSGGKLPCILSTAIIQSEWLSLCSDWREPRKTFATREGRRKKHASARTHRDQRLSIHPSIHRSTVLWLGLGLFFSFLILYTVGRTPWMGDQPVGRPLPTHRTTQTQNKRTETSMPWVGFETTFPTFEREKTVHALDRAATVIGDSFH